MEPLNIAPNLPAKLQPMEGSSFFNTPPPPLMTLPTEGQSLDHKPPPPSYQEGPLVAELYLAECTLQAREGNFGKYFCLISHKHPEKTLKLYKPAAMKLINMLPEAFNKAQTMEGDNYPDGCSYTVATINKRNNVEINLYVQMFQGKSFVFLRLYVEREDGSYQPTTFAVEFSNMDNIRTITNFINQNKYK